LADAKSHGNGVVEDGQRPEACPAAEMLVEAEPLAGTAFVDFFFRVATELA